MSHWELGIWWAALVIGMIGMALSYGIETGLYCLNRVKLEVRAEHGPMRRAARLLRDQMARPEDLLAVSLICIISFGDLAATAAARLLAARGYSDSAVILINAAVLTPVFFVFLESVPKEIFRLEADRLTYRFAPGLITARALLTVVPVLPAMRWIAAGAGRLLGAEAGEGAGGAATARERVATMLKDTAGTLSESQLGLVDRAVAFRALRVGDVMVEWPSVKWVPADWTREQVVRYLVRERHSFYPVVDRGFGGGGGRVVGVLRHRDPFVRPGPTAGAMVVEPARLPARMPLTEAVAALRRARTWAGIVEEAGRPIGFVTQADLVEPLVGRAIG